MERSIHEREVARFTGGFHVQVVFSLFFFHARERWSQALYLKKKSVGEVSRSMGRGGTNKRTTYILPLL